MIAKTAAEDSRHHDGQEDGEVHEDCKRSCHDPSGPGQYDAEQREEQWMGEIGKIRMTSQKGEKRIQRGGIFLIGEHREKENGGAKSVKDTKGAKLVRGVDGAKQGIAGKDKMVVIPKEQCHGEPEETANGGATLLHELLELSDMNGQPAAQEEDEDVVKHPIV